MPGEHWVPRVERRLSWVTTSLSGEGMAGAGPESRVTAWELIRNADAQAPGQASGARFCIPTPPQASLLHTKSSLESRAERSGQRLPGEAVGS